jgi:polyhydroxybutyrate depolymerase
VERIASVNGGFHREYLLARPRLAGAPLLVFLHGTGATAQWVDEETGWSAIAAREGFALVLPEALRPDLSRPPKFLTNPQRWNDGLPSRSGWPSADDVAFLSSVVEDALDRTRADERRVYVSGFSNGAAMTFRLAIERADRIAAIAPVAGYCWVSDPRPTRAIPTLYIIGSLDPLVPLRGGEVRSPWQHRYVRREPVTHTLDRWAHAIGCRAPSQVESDDGKLRTEIYPGPVRFRVVTIDGLGHHWPGGRGGLNERIAGPTLAGIKGAELVLDFLSRYHV